MKILSNDEIRNIEKSTLNAQNIATIDLIERVGIAVAREIKQIVHPERPLVVLAGWGNNGADALASARILALEGYRPTIFLFNIGGDRLNENCKIMRDRLKETGITTFHEITGNERFQWPEPDQNTTIIDGLFGSGLNRPLPRTFQLLAQNIKQSRAMVISIDIPSGLFSEWNGNASRQNMMQANITLAIEFPRLAFMLAENSEVVGNVKVMHIGYDKRAILNAPYTFSEIDHTMVKPYLIPRKRFCSKADFGHALIFAGSMGMAGASVLAATSALRAGAGKVSVHSCSENRQIVQTCVPSAIFKSDSNKSIISEMPFSTAFNSFAVGPGIGVSDETSLALEKFVKDAAAAGKRIILDADALNIIARKKIILSYLTPLSIITPHAGEFDRIFGQSESDEERLKKALKVAEDYNLIIVLKGHRSAVIRPDGKIMFNSTGTPAMATPGSGDVLTGILAGLIATGMISELAAFIGIYIHGLAGEIAAQEHGEYGVIAEDIANSVGKAIRQIMCN